MDRREFLKSSGAVAAGVGTGQVGPAQEKTPAHQAPPPNAPNVVLIIPHDLGQHMGCYGIDEVNTDNLDALAEEGVRFENSYSTSAVCSPGRGSLLTGRYPQSNELMGLTHAPWGWSLGQGERAMPALLQEAGYETYMIGLHHVDRENPRRLGYQHFRSEEAEIDETVQATQDLFRQAADQERPFFAQVGFQEVHRSFDDGKYDERGVFVPPYLQDTPAMREDLKAFQGTIKHFDEHVGQILDALQESGLAEDTLVIMTSEHGIPYPGAKWCARKAGIEVPLIMHQPGTALEGGKTFTEVISNVDVLPTLLDMLDLPIPENVQGVSFKDFIEGTSREPPRRRAFAQYTEDMKRDNEARCVITKNHHLIRYFDQGRTVKYPVSVDPKRFADHTARCRTAGARPFAQLFDIQRDPYELNDIGGKEKNQTLVEDLSGPLLSWMTEVGDPLLNGRVRLPYYNRAMEDFFKAGSA